MTGLRKASVLALLIAFSALLAGCGSSGSSSSSSESSESASSTSSSSPESESGDFDLALAKELTAPFIGQPTAFPVNEPLEERPPSTTTIAFLQCSTPFCGLMAEQLQGAADAMGVQFKVVKAGASVSELQGAMSSIIAIKPDAVVIPAVEENIPEQLKELDEMGIPVAGAGVMYPEKYGLDVDFNNAEQVTTVGEALAGWAAQEKGEETEAVYYATPELSFSKVEEAGFKDALAKICSSCNVRTVNIPLSEFGTKAPSHVVSDLQANPETNIAIFASQEAASGLPAQMKTAGIEDVYVNGYGGTPSNMQDVQSGTMRATIAVDTNMMMWAIVNGLSRLVTDQPLAEDEAFALAPSQLLDQAELQGVDVEKGYVSYPDGEKRFEELWSGK